MLPPDVISEVKMVKKCVGGRNCARNPMGELTGLPDPIAGLRGWKGKRRGGEEEKREGRGEERWEREREGTNEGKGKRTGKKDGRRGAGGGYGLLALAPESASIIP